MKTYRTKSTIRRLRRFGFTLIETAVAFSAMMGVGVALVVLMRQQVTFNGIVVQQSFITREAPVIGNLLARVFAHSDHFFVYQNMASGQAGGAPILSGGSAVHLFYPTPTGTYIDRWITVEPVGSLYKLVCYSSTSSGTTISWIISSGLSGASFGCTQGVLAATLNGPHGEVISYYGGSQ